MFRLVIIEYPTGSGKTELMLYLSDLLLNRVGSSGNYIAMPTKATSNQMYGRVREALERRYQHNGNEGSSDAEDWFGAGKRALLAPFGVGAINQALLSVLPAKHHSVRLSALRAALAQMEQDNASSEFCSREHLISSPADERLFSQHGHRWPDDERRLALTRDIPPGINIVPLIDEPLVQMAQRAPSADETAMLRSRIFNPSTRRR